MNRIYECGLVLLTQGILLLLLGFDLLHGTNIPPTRIVGVGASCFGLGLTILSIDWLRRLRRRNAQ